MNFDPQFMLQRDLFYKERQAVRSLEDWRSFYKKWLDNSSWPTKPPELIREEGLKKLGPVLIGGRIWGFTSFNDDISPEARYEYVFTMKTIGDPLKFPHEAELPRTAAEGFSQHCPYCELSTNDVGDDICPQCGRKLVYVRSER